MNHRTAAVIKFCAEECARQQSGELSVANMVEAYQMACQCWLANTTDIRPWVIKNLGQMVDPEANANGFRQTPVLINAISIPWSNIERNIESICNLQKEANAAEFYYAFERIHPFIDGNGRVGAILYNWLNDTLFTPEAAPLMHFA